MLLSREPGWTTLCLFPSFRHKYFHPGTAVSRNSSGLTSWGQAKQSLCLRLQKTCIWKIKMSKSPFLRGKMQFFPPERRHFGPLHPSSNYGFHYISSICRLHSDWNVSLCQFSTSLCLLTSELSWWIALTQASPKHGDRPCSERFLFALALMALV